MCAHKCALSLAQVPAHVLERKPARASSQSCANAHAHIPHMCVDAETQIRSQKCVCKGVHKRLLTYAHTRSHNTHINAYMHTHAHRGQAHERSHFMNKHSQARTHTNMVPFVHAQAHALMPLHSDARTNTSAYKHAHIPAHKHMHSPAHKHACTPAHKPARTYTQINALG
jgi:hypothetical protein